MNRKFAVYKGLQKPLVYKGFKGKFIYWGVASLLVGLVLGALTMSLINTWFGVMVLAGSVTGGLFYTAAMQKKGLHSKIRSNKIFILNQYGRKSII
jgi:hypothetical protein